MLDNCTYDIIKLLYKLSSELWFIQKHAKDNAKKIKDTECLKTLEMVEKDLERNIKRLSKFLGLE